MHLTSRRRTALLAPVLCLTVLAGGADSAAAKPCGSIKANKLGVSVKNLRASGTGCPTARKVAKTYRVNYRSRKGWTCSQRGDFRKPKVTCRNARRKVTFSLRFSGAIPLPPAAPALPVVGGG